MHRNQSYIKQELKSILNSDNIDISAVLALSNELAATDENNVRFSVDAGLINKLGKELVGKGETAISELIKNAYDADATEVNLVFEGALRKGGTLTIDDDGVGMSFQELLNGFMRISSSDKVHNPCSRLYNRKRAGKKGIGRFATQRLGHRLTIFTQTSDSYVALKTTIDWDDFTIDKNINEISASIQYVPKKRDHGTILVIENLNVAWGDALITKTYKHIRNLLLPESLSKRRVEGSTKEDPGFKVNIYRETKSKENVVIDEDVAFFSHALAEIEGYVDKDGFGFWKVHSPKLGLLDEKYHQIGKISEDDYSRFEYIHDVYFKTHYFIYESSLIPKSLFSYVKNLGNELGGIKLYRNGFRISPYGEKGNDWLGLDESVRKRRYLVPHQNQSFFGFVEIGDKATEIFEETSSREGLIENEAYHELCDFAQRAVIEGAKAVGAARGRKVSAAQKDWVKKGKDKIEEGLQLMQSLSKAEKRFDIGPSRLNAVERRILSEAYESIMKGLDETKEKHAKLVDEINMLRIFAALGLVIGEFVHEIKNYLPGFEAEISYLERILRDDEIASKRVGLLRHNIESFTSYTLYFDKSISANVKRDLKPIDIKERIHSFLDTISDNSKKANIDIDNNLDAIEVLLADLVTVPMHPSEWASILFNLYTNAKKAIRKAHVDKGRINLSCGESEGKVILEFSDNGIGVPPENRLRIFDAFFTTSSISSNASTSDIDTYTGTGLGLKIVSDILSSYNGEIKLKDRANDGFTTTFVIEIPKFN